MLFLVSAGLFVTSLGQPNVIGQLPFLFLFKNTFHLDAAQQANFFAVTNFAWYMKPLAGLLCDSFPLFGTRRRSYLVVSAVVAGTSWLLFALVPGSYVGFFGIMVMLNVAMVIASTTIGGLLVEVGQAGHATGRLASARYAIDGVVSIVAGPLGGWLAARAFGWTAGMGAALLFALVPTTLVLMRERPSEKVHREVWAAAAQQFRLILRSRPMWSASALLFLVFIAPGLGIVLRYHQEDDLHFTTAYIGELQALAGAGSIVATALYARLCKRYSLRMLLTWGILLNALSSVLYLWYRTPLSAAIIDTANGFLAVLGILPLFDLAARATPRGSESFGYSLLVSVYNIAVFAVSYPLGSWLYERPDHYWHHDFNRLVWLNTATSLLALVLVPFIPKVLVAMREGHPNSEVSANS